MSFIYVRGFGTKDFIPDGEEGPEWQKSLRAYQTAEGLGLTGALDDDTVAHIDKQLVEHGIDPFNKVGANEEITDRPSPTAKTEDALPVAPAQTRPSSTIRNDGRVEEHPTD